LVSETGTPAAKSIGIFGGSFDPIHNGHVEAARLAMCALELDEVVFVPAGDQWQKSGQTAAKHRLAMVRLAIAGQSGFTVSTVDIDRAGPTYTADTLSELAHAYPGDKLFFILGSDALKGIETWNRATEVLDLAQFVVLTRPGFELEIPSLAEGRVWVLEVPALDISSTGFREGIANHTAVTDLVPQAVLRYIGDNNLYGFEA